MELKVNIIISMLENLHYNKPTWKSTIETADVKLII